MRGVLVVREMCILDGVYLTCLRLSIFVLFFGSLCKLPLNSVDDACMIGFIGISKLRDEHTQSCPVPSRNDQSFEKKTCVLIVCRNDLYNGGERNERQGGREQKKCHLARFGRE